MVNPATVKVFGHRGGSVHAPENTLAAFSAALKAGVAGIELDVQRCASGELVVIHDHDLSRTTNGAGRVVDTSLTDLKKLSAGAWFKPEFESERIPTLAEVLELVEGNVVVNIEVKNAPVEYPGIEDALIEVIGHYKYPEQLIISSFDHPLLKRISENSDLEVAILSECIFYDLDGYAAGMNASWWHPSFSSLRADAVEEAHAVGLKVNTWYVHSTADWLAAIDMGVDGIITGDPDGLISLLDQMSLVNDSVC